MEISPVVKRILAVFFAYLILFLISYSTFLQIPVCLGEDLVCQSIVEQSVTWIPFVLAYMLLFKTLSKREKKNNLIEKETRLLIPSVVMVFLTGISIGVHFTSQIIEDALINQKDLFVYRLTYFLNEQIGHLLILPGLLFSLALALIEVNRKRPKLKKIDNWMEVGREGLIFTRELWR